MKPEEAIAAPDLARIAFFALDQPGVDTVTVSQSKTGAGNPCLKVESSARTDSAKSQFQFFALAANMKHPPAATVPLYEYIERGSDRRAYSTEKSLELPGFERQEKPICRV